MLLEIDSYGKSQITQLYALTIFIIPPNLSELKKRLKNRNPEYKKLIEDRFKKAEKELQDKNTYD